MRSMVEGAASRTPTPLRQSSGLPPPPTGEELRLVRLERATSGVTRRIAELLLDPKQLVVLRQTVGPAGAPRLDLPAAERNGEIGDGRILRFAGAVRHNGGVSRALRQPDGRDGL